MELEVLSDFGTSKSPARVNRRTGVIQLNIKRLSEIPDHLEPFIFWHEVGHYKLQTKDEVLADAFASKKFLESGGSLKASVHALSDILNTNHPHSIKRIKAQLKRALIYDYKHNGNKEAIETLNFINKMENSSEMTIPELNFYDPMNQDFDDLYGTNEHSEFECFDDLQDDFEIFEEVENPDEISEFGGRRRAIRKRKKAMKAKYGKGNWRKKWKEYKRSGGKQEIIDQLKKEKAAQKGQRDLAKLGLTDAPTPDAQTQAAMAASGGASPDKKKKDQTTYIIVAVVVVVAVVVFMKMRKK